VEKIIGNEFEILALKKIQRFKKYLDEEFRGEASDKSIEHMMARYYETVRKYREGEGVSLEKAVNR
jgi:hypothetical protein